MADVQAVSQLNWRPGGARGNRDQLFTDGDQYLFAVRLRGEYRGEYWHFAAVSCSCDSETPAQFYDASGEPWDEWTWEHVEWFAELGDVDPPSDPPQ